MYVMETDDRSRREDAVVQAAEEIRSSGMDASIT
jgi:hypothetical protein